MTTETTILSPKTSRRNKLLTAIALTLIISLGAFLRLYELGAYSIGNTYYAATVKSMLSSWSNFFFGAFEPGGSVTVDKPPLGFWVQSVSAALLGVSGFSLAFPNALAGIGSIGLTYHLIRKQFNTAAGLVAALTLAVVPVTISTERNNTIDGLLVFVLLLAAWAVWKSVESGKFRYLLLGAFIVGLGFNIKMLQAYMVIPALYALYFFGAKQGWLTRIWHLGVATTLLFAVSLSWAVVVDLVPEENRPYIGSSDDNTVMELIIGHNGLSRLGLNDNSRGPGGGNDGTRPQPPANDGQRIVQVDGDGQPHQFSTDSGQFPNRPQVNLPPLNRQPPPEALDACLGLRVDDACTVNLPNRDVEGTCRLTQQNDLVCAPNDRPAPQSDGQFVANAPNAPDGNGPDGGQDGNRPGGGRNGGETGQAGVFRLFSEPLVTEASWVLPLALISILLTSTTLFLSSDDFSRPTAEAVTTKKKKYLALVLWTLWLLPVMAYFSFTTGLFHRYYLIMMGPALAALVGMAFWSVAQLFKRNCWLALGTLILLVVITLGFQAFMLSSYDTAKWLLPLAVGCSVIGLTLLVIASGAKQSPSSDAEIATSRMHASRNDVLRTAALTIILLAMLAAPLTWSVMVTTEENPNVALPTATLNDTQSTSFMTPNNTVMSSNEEAIMDYLLANTDPESYLLATVNARSAAPYILETGRSVLTFGGFSGRDQVIDAAGVAAMVANGELRYILYSENIGNSHRDIAAWVTESCLPVSVPGVEVQEQRAQQNPNQQNVRLGAPDQKEVLYDCAQ